MATPTLSAISFTNPIYDQMGGQIQATIGGTAYNGTYKFIQSSYNSNFLAMDEIMGIYQNEETDGIFSMYNLKIDNAQE
jgi:hypothetical protein